METISLDIYYGYGIYWQYSRFDAMKIRQPSRLEMQVLSVLWDRGPSTVRQVMEVMPDGKERAYTTILSVMQGLERKRLVAHDAEGNAHVFRARVTRQEVTGPWLRGLVRQVFGGSAATALQHLLAEEQLSREELAEIKVIISRHEEAGGQSSGGAATMKGKL